MVAIAKSVYTGESDSESIASEPNAVAPSIKLKVALIGIQSDWKTGSIDEALMAAQKLGNLVACKTIEHEIASDFLEEYFKSRKVDEQHWDVVNTTFQNSALLPFSKDFVLGKSFPAAAANDNEPAKQTPPLPPKMHPAPFTSQAAGGLLGEISEWITTTAVIPVSELSLAASIALLGGMFGDLALGPTKSGVNLFITTVMGVASGKGHAPRSIMNLAKLAAKAGAVTNGDPTSYAAIERMLRKNKSTAIVMDEFGITLQDVNSRQKNAASASIRKFLLAIYDQADSIFHGRQYASSDTKKDDSPIEGPALTVLGMTTGHALYNGLSEDSLGEGFISRFVFVEGNHPETIVVPSLSRIQSNPSVLVESLKRAANDFPKSKGNLTAFTNAKHIVPFEDGEEGEGYKRYAEVFLWQHWIGWEQRQRDVNGRAAENTIRLATIRAISRNPVNPIIVGEDVEWGWAIVHQSISVITAGVERHMSGSIPEALRKAIKEALRTAKDQTLPWSYLLQRQGVSQAVQKDVADAMSWLIETGQVASLAGGAVRPGPGQKFRLIAQ